MKQMKIHPYLIDNTRLAGYYELLFEDGFDLRIFDKKRDKELDEYFLPAIKEYLFWTFNLRTKEEIKEYKDMPDDLKSAICSRYPCNVFKKKDVIVICFNTGVCFAITNNEDIFDTLTRYKQGQKMQEINLRDEDTYEFADDIEAHQFMYILELYKMVYLKKINKEMQSSKLFDKARASFVDFTQNVYVTRATDKDDYAKTLDKEFNIDELYVSVENQFELLYKNSKLDENINNKRLIILLLLVVIIVVTLALM